MTLTNTQCLNAKPQGKAYKLTDGLGLYLEVMPSGSKYWRWQYRINGKRPRLSLGTYPDVSLKDVREKRSEYRQLLQDGIDPAFHKRQEKLKRNLQLGTSFESIAREWHEVNLDRWKPKTADAIMVRLEKDIFPSIGSAPLTDLTPADILATIRIVEKRGAKELARKSLQYVGRVFRYAMVTNRTDRNPAHGLTEALQAKKEEHYRALEYSELPDFIFALKTNPARLYPYTLMATELLLLTFARTGELIGATWDELDLKAARWRISGDRMKMGKDHIVPLSRQALKLFEKLYEIAPNAKYVFPHYSDPRKHMSNGTILKAIRLLGFKDKTTGHGFRALAMTSIKEELGYRHEVIDRQLAHQPHSKVDRAYDRAQFLDERTQMMQEWADLVDAAYKEALSRAV